MSENKGVLYIAMSDRYFEEATISVKSLKKSNPGIQVACITDKERESEFFDEILVKDPNQGSDKVYYLAESPFEKTVFLDTDTLIVGEITSLFTLLNQFDISLAQEPLNIEQKGVNQKFKDIPETFPFLNTGVIAYKNNEQFEVFSDKWRENYEKRMEEYEETPWDQPSFQKTLYNSDLRFSVLPTEYNARLYHGGVISNDIKIAHHRLLETNNKGLSVDINVSEATKEINSEEGHRIFYYNKGKIAVEKRKEKITRMLRVALSNYGLKETVIKAFRKLKNRDLKLNEI